MDKSTGINSNFKLAESGGFEPPWELVTPKSISSRSRYDHFGNSPGYVMRLAVMHRFKTGGESGIRTRGTPLWAYTRFPVVLLRPLRHLSAR